MRIDVKGEPACIGAGSEGFLLRAHSSPISSAKNDGCADDVMHSVEPSFSRDGEGVVLVGAGANFSTLSAGLWGIPRCRSESSATIIN